MVDWILNIIAILTTLFISTIVITPIVLIGWWIKTLFLKRRKPKDIDNKIEEYNKFKKEVEDERKKRRSEVTGDGFRYSRPRELVRTREPATEIRNIKDNIDKQLSEERRIPIPSIDNDRDDEPEPDNNESEPGEDSEAIELHKPVDLKEKEVKYNGSN